MRRAHKIFRLMLAGYVGLVLTAGAMSVAVLKSEHIRLLAVQTGSMTPVLRTGDAILVRPLQAGRLHVGQVVSYTSPQNAKTITHRIVAIDRAHGQVTTRGDALGKPDTPIALSAVGGTVVVVLPQLGKLLDFARRPVGLALLVYLPALVIVVNEIKGLGRHFGGTYYRLHSVR